MQQSKLFRILMGFKEEDWKGCDKYLSLRHARKTDLNRLYRYILKHKDELDSTKLHIDIANDKIERHLSRKSFQNIMSRLVKEIERYFIWEQIQADEIEKNLKLLKAYNKRGLYKDYDSLAATIVKELSNENHLELFKDYWLFQIHHEQFFSDNPVKYSKGQLLLLNATKHLDRLYAQLHTFYDNTKIHFGRIINKDLILLEENARSDESYNSIDTLSDLLIQTKQFIIFESVQNYRVLRSSFIQHHYKLDNVVASAILISLTARLPKLINKGVDIDPNELLDLHLLGLEQKYYLVNESLDPTRFTNIVNVAVSCQKLDLAYSIVDRYADIIPTPERLQASSLALSEIDLWKGNFDVAVERVRDMSYDRMTTTLTQRLLLLRCYFMIHKDDLTFLESVFKNFNAFIHNNKSKISKNNSDGCLKLSSILKKIAKKNSSTKIKKEISQASSIKNRSWLLFILNDKEGSR